MRRGGSAWGGVSERQKHTSRKRIGLQRHENDPKFKPIELRNEQFIVCFECTVASQRMSSK